METSQDSNHMGTWLEVLSWIASLEKRYYFNPQNNDSCNDRVFWHSALELTILWGRALSLKEIWHGNSTVPEVRVLTFCSRVQLIILDKILEKIKTHLTGRDLFERSEIQSIISFLESNFKV